MQVKKCNRCDREKPFSEFSFKNKTTGRLSGYCKECNREYNRNHYRSDKKKHYTITSKNKKVRVENNKNFILDYLKIHPCVDCGESDPLVLEFDHIKGEKRAGICKMVSTGFGLDSIKEEIEKCVVRCANCHRRRTMQTLEWFRSLAMSSNWNRTLDFQSS